MYHIINNKMNTLMKKLIIPIIVILFTVIFIPQVSAADLTVECSATPEQAYTGASITWTANVSGGTAPYTYNWSGDVEGTNQSETVVYSESGGKMSTVTVVDASSTPAEVSSSCLMTIIPPLEFNSCEPNEEISYVGYEVIWKVSVSGGIGPYFITLTGDDGLSGDSTDTPITYLTSGVKNATVSGIGSSVGQVIPGDWACTPTEIYDLPDELTATCELSEGQITKGKSATWTANVSGGTTPYTYNWSGDDELSGDTETITKTYDTAGTKSAELDVMSSDGHVISNISCPTLEVTNPNRSSGGGHSSSGGRRKKKDDKKEPEPENVVPNTPVVVKTPAYVTPKPAVSKAATSTEDATTSTTTSDDLQNERSGLLAGVFTAFGNVTNNLFWIILGILILAGLVWLIIIWKKRKQN